MASNSQGAVPPAFNLERLSAGAPSPKLTKGRLLSTVFITITPKGGAGKTEVTDCTEAAITLGGQTCQLIDVDDGNRGISRRVGKNNVVKVEWSTPVVGAADWIARNAGNASTMIFDLGAGIDSSDLPVMAFLGSVWRLLADGGARIVLCAVVSTNAPTSAFIERIDRRYGSLGEIVIVCNNQDGSSEFPAELSTLPQRRLNLAQLHAGIQAVRLSRRDRLSSVVSSPSPGYALASAFMARRILNFASQPLMREFVSDRALERLGELSETAPRHIRYMIGTRRDASDLVIQENARLMEAERALREPMLRDAEILARAHEFRRQYETFAKLTVR